MRWLVFVALAGCEFEHGSVSGDGADAGGTESRNDDARGGASFDAAADALGGAPPQCWTTSSYVMGPTGRKYRAPHSDGTWSAAQATCAADGAHLVVIDDAAENAHVSSIMDQDSWIGLTDANQDGNLRWVTGLTVTYANWATGEPNNGAGTSCGFIRRNDNKWLLGDCGSLEYVCECPYP